MSNPYHIEEGAPEIEERVERPVLLPLLDFPQQPARLEHENTVEEPYGESSLPIGYQPFLFIQSDPRRLSWNCPNF